MKTVSVLAMLVGLVVVTGLVAWQGIGTIADSLSLAGWRLLWLGPFYVVVIVIGVHCWRLLFAPRQAPAPGVTLHAVWIGQSVNWLLPVAQIGGEIARTRLIWKQGCPGPVATATVVVDKTIQAISQVAYALIGLALFAWVQAGQQVIPAVLVAVVVLGAAIYAFYRVQQAGLFAPLARFLERWMWWDREADFAGGGERVDAAVRDVYSRRGPFVASNLWRLASRFVEAGEVWLVLLFLGHPIGFTDAVIIESLGQAVRAAAFLVPGALGVQEGGYMLLAAVAGLSPDIGLSLSLAKRVRELMIGLPGLVAWQVAEGKHLLRRGREGADGGGSGE